MLERFSIVSGPSREELVRSIFTGERVSFRLNPGTLRCHIVFLSQRFSNMLSRKHGWQKVQCWRFQALAGKGNSCHATGIYSTETGRGSVTLR